jgi:hypothetical protein
MEIDWSCPPPPLTTRCLVEIRQVVPLVQVRGRSSGDRTFRETALRSFHRQGIEDHHHTSGRSTLVIIREQKHKANINRITKRHHVGNSPTATTFTGTLNHYHEDG